LLPPEKRMSKMKSKSRKRIKSEIRITRRMQRKRGAELNSYSYS